MLYTDKSVISRQVRILEDMGFVERQTDPDRPPGELPRRDARGDREGERGPRGRSGESVPQPAALGRGGRASAGRAPGAVERSHAVAVRGSDSGGRWYSSSGMPSASAPLRPRGRPSGRRAAVPTQRVRIRLPRHKRRPVMPLRYRDRSDVRRHRAGVRVLDRADRRSARLDAADRAVHDPGARRSRRARARARYPPSSCWWMRPSPPRSSTATASARRTGSRPSRASGRTRPGRSSC